MRCALLLVAGCAVLLGQPSLASGYAIRLSRPQTSYADFMVDRNACISASWHRGSTFSGSVGHYVTTGKYDLKDFADCMNARGYLLDPKNGYRAAKYTTLDGGGYLLQPD